MHTVVISKKHTGGTTFSNRYNGALVQACKEQLPDLQVEQEFFDHVRTADRNCYDFDFTVYKPSAFLQLQNNQIREIRVTLVKNNIR